MQPVFFHLAYLLTRHECVIIPGLGAFVVSSAPAKRATESGVLYPPAQVLGFNPEISHNDGILVNSVAKEKKISYKDAQLVVRQFADEIQKQLHEGKTIQIPWIGSLSLSAENKIIFTPDSRQTCNISNYGLANFYLPLLKEIEASLEVPVLKKEDKEAIRIPLSRRILHRTGSVAAAVLAFFLLATPVNNNRTEQPECAGILPIPIKIQEAGNVNKMSEMNASFAEDAIPVRLPVPETVVAPVNSRRYYIVIASCPTKESAEQILAGIRSAEFPEANITSNENNHRIYVRELENKEEAEHFLLQFRASHPKHANAWLLSERVKK